MIAEIMSFIGLWICIIALWILRLILAITGLVLFIILFFKDKLIDGYSYFIDALNTISYGKTLFFGILVSIPIYFCTLLLIKLIRDNNNDER